MGKKDTDLKASGLSRRDFLKATAATVAASGVADFAFSADKAMAYEGVDGYTIKPSTCPYCSASCGQRVVVRDSDQAVVDIYGDFDSPFNGGGLCAKGAGAFQLVNNDRRLGVGTGHASLTPAMSSQLDYAAPGASGGFAYRRVGTGSWARIDLDQAFQEVAAGYNDGSGNSHLGLVGYRETVDAANYYNSYKVAFFGSSHMNNEPNHVYRKIIANFGTSNVEHQARI